MRESGCFIPGRRKGDGELGESNIFVAVPGRKYLVSIEIRYVVCGNEDGSDISANSITFITHRFRARQSVHFPSLLSQDSRFSPPSQKYGNVMLESTT